MQAEKKKQKRAGRPLTGLLLTLLLLAAVLGLRVWFGGGLTALLTETEPTPFPGLSIETPPVTATPRPTARPAPTATPYPTYAPLPSATLAPVVRAPIRRSIRYTADSYALVTEMVSTYRQKQADGMDAVRALYAPLKEIDAELGAAWENIMEYWNYANTELPVSTQGLPDGLPQDNSLCLVVLGFQLMPDGSMDAELVGRCETALAAAEQYPNAYVAVCGGGTAYQNRSITEAGAMADWLAARGLDRKRLIVEDRSLTTGENAAFLTAILLERYPSVRSLALITSDYHVPMGCVLFNTAAELSGVERGELPFTVAANAAFHVPRMAGTEGPDKQAAFLWSLADPRY